jgi:hypothetical protein
MSLSLNLESNARKFQLITKETDQYRVLLNGINEVTDLVSMYAEAEQEYNSRHEQPVHITFATRLEDFYFHVLEFLVKAICNFSLPAPQRSMRDMFGLEGWEVAIQKIKKDHETCQQVATISAIEALRRDSRTFVKVMEQSQAAIRALMQMINFQSDNNTRIVNWVSTIDVQSDHNLAKDKLGKWYE